MKTTKCKNCKFSKIKNGYLHCIKRNEVIRIIVTSMLSYSESKEILTDRCSFLNPKGNCGYYRKKWYIIFD